MRDAGCRLSGREEEPVPPGFGSAAGVAAREARGGGARNEVVWFKPERVVPSLSGFLRLSNPPLPTVHRGL